MNRGGNGNAPSDDGAAPAPERPDGDERMSDALNRPAARAAEIAELSRRALTAEVHLLAYVDELEAEVRRLRRQVGEAALSEAPDGVA